MINPTSLLCYLGLGLIAITLISLGNTFAGMLVLGGALVILFLSTKK